MIAKGILERHSITGLTIDDPASKFDTTLTALASTLLNSNSSKKKLTVRAASAADCQAIITAVTHPLDASVKANLQHKKRNGSHSLTKNFRSII